MARNYIIVDTEILSDTYQKVIKAKQLLESQQVKDVSEAVKQVQLSRSAYYKYKDYVFTLDQKAARHAVLSLLLTDEKGVLSNVLNLLSFYKVNLLTINQNMPIHHKAACILTLDVSEITFSIQQIMQALSEMEHVEQVKLIGVE